MGIFFNRGKKKNQEVSTPKEIKREINEVLKDKKVKQLAITNAKDIQSKLKNWFTIEQLQKELHMKEYAAAFDLMNLLCLFELAYRKEAYAGMLKYKITFTPEDKLHLLQQELAEAEGTVSRLKQEIINVGKKALAVSKKI